MSLEGIDPRVKLTLLLAISSVSVFTRSPIKLVILLAFTLLLLALGGVGLADAARRARNMLKLIFSLFVLQCVFNRSGDALFSVAGVAIITAGGLAAALTVSLRLLIILSSAVIVLSGQTRDYLLALIQLKMPYEIAFMVMAAIGFIPLIREAARDVLCAVQMRGVRLKKASIRNKLAVYMRIVLPVVADSINRSKRTSIAMEARAFRAFPQRTSMRRLTMKKADWVYMCVSCFIAVAIACVPV